MSKIRKLFVAEKPSIYLLANVGDPGWHKFGQTWPAKGSSQCVASRVSQTMGGGRNLRPKAVWYPDRIAEVNSTVDRAALRDVERAVAAELVKQGFERQGKGDYFKAPAEVIWQSVTRTMRSRGIKFSTTRYS